MALWPHQSPTATQEVFDDAVPQQNGGQPFLSTALDLAPSGETTSQFYFLGVNPVCAPLINSHTGSASSCAQSGTLQRLLVGAGPGTARLPQAAHQPFFQPGKH